MGDIVEEAIENLQVLVEEHDANITAGDLPYVIANRSALARLIQNLLSNAIKYRGEDTPEVRVEAQQGDQGWIFSVADNGRGMDEQQIGRAFDLFWRGGGGEPGDAGGEGIGLAACKRIVERHGGRIWIESEPCAGSTFFFSLPVEPAGMSGRSGAPIGGASG
jgi:signal transduction histidine kinase